MVNKTEIDIVVPWVSGSNLRWREQFNKYSSNETKDVFTESGRYRSSFKLLELWMQSVEKNMPWIRKIHLVIDRTDFDERMFNFASNKINIVFHDEYIPNEYLPTFNSNVIELYSYKISGLSEKFILFNDDCFAINYVEESVFFSKNGIPRDVDVIKPINMTKKYGHILLNNVILINEHFSWLSFKKQYFLKRMPVLPEKSIIKNTCSLMLFTEFVGWHDEHLPVAYQKEDFIRVLDKQQYLLNRISYNKFRSTEDISHLLIRFWRLAEGRYSRRRMGELGIYMEMEPKKTKDKLLKTIEKKPRFICINDVDMTDDQASLEFHNVEEILESHLGNER